MNDAHARTGPVDDHDMASVLGRTTGLPVCRLKDARGRIVHAVVVLDRHLPRSSWRCVDSSGTRPFESVLSDIEGAFGPIVVSRDEEPAPAGPGDEEVLAEARGIPHLAELMENHVRLSPDVPPPGFEPILRDSHAIARHVVENSPGYVDEHMVDDAYIGCVAHLRWVPIEAVSPGPEDCNVPSSTKERRYARMPAGSAPPILVEDGEIVDGNHRYRVAVARRQKGMWAYVIE